MVTADQGEAPVHVRRVEGGGGDDGGGGSSTARDLWHIRDTTINEAD